MSTYRAYRLDQRGRIMTAAWVEAPSDDAAKAQAAEDLCDGDTPKVELWQATRLVDQIECPRDDED